MRSTTDSSNEVWRPLQWACRAMDMRIDIEDKEALLQALDES
jgi:hypothetical protein